MQDPVRQEGHIFIILTDVISYIFPLLIVFYKQ